MWYLLIPLILTGESKMVKLPEPAKDSNFSVEKAINERRSVRSYKEEPLSLKEISQILWAAQGTVASGRRAAPSAGATYPIEVYLIVGNVEGLEPGLYKYNQKDHSIIQVKKGDLRKSVSDRALRQDMILKAPATIVITAVFERTRARYGARAERYVYMEAGHVGQNIYLQATALGLGTVAVGAFIDSEVKSVLGIEEEPLYLYPLGKR